MSLDINTVFFYFSTTIHAVSASTGKNITCYGRELEYRLDNADLFTEEELLELWEILREELTTYGEIYNVIVGEPKSEVLESERDSYIYNLYYDAGEEHNYNGAKEAKEILLTALRRKIKETLRGQKEAISAKIPEGHTYNIVRGVKFDTLRRKIKGELKVK
jgi:hypothetical protein